MTRPHSGSARIKRPTGRPGEAGARLRQLVRERHAFMPLSGLVFEAQHVDPKINPQTIYLLIGGGFLVEEIAYALGIPVHSCDIATWRKHFLGKGSFRTRETEDGRKITGRQQAKSLVMDVCAGYGWHPADDNAADALGILDYYLSIMPAGRRLPTPWRDASFMTGLAR